MDSEEPNKLCNACGGSIGGESTSSRCPGCLIMLGLSLEPAETSFVPRTFAGYELLHQVGSGGMGVVYRARQISVDRVVALKMLLHSQLDSPIAVRRFQIEAEAAARLAHAHIVPIFEVGEYEGHCFFSMAFIQGATLQQRIALSQYRIAESDGISPRACQLKIVSLLQRIARAVEYAHGKGVLHRDLKPANILIDENEVPYVSDFGLAKLMDDEIRLSQTDAAPGTPSYMSPEQTRGERLSVATDVYSLGVIFYELLTGRPPFQAQTRLELARNIGTREPTPPRRLNSRIDSELQAVCLKCIEKDPSRRYASAGLLADDLGRWLDGLKVLARAAGPMQRALRWARHNRLAASFIASLLALVLTLLALVFVIIEKIHSETVAENAKNLSTRRDIARREIWNRTGIHSFWSDPEDSGPIIKSDLLAWAARIDSSESLSSDIVHYRIGMLIEEKDAEKSVVSYGPLFHYLEGKLSNQIKTTLFDLRVYKRKESAIDALGTDKIDLLKIGGASFVAASTRYPGITPLVVQLPVKTIFTRNDSDIKTSKT